MPRISKLTTSNNSWTSGSLLTRPLMFKWPILRFLSPTNCRRELTGSTSSCFVGSGNAGARIGESLHYLKTGRTDPVKGNHILKNFKTPRLDLTTFNLAPLVALVTIYSSVIPRNSIGANGTFVTGPGLGETVSGRFAYGSFRLLSVRLRPICQFTYDSYVKALKLNCLKFPIIPYRKNYDG